MIFSELLLLPLGMLKLLAENLVSPGICGILQFAPESRSEAGPDHVLIFEQIKVIFSLMICEENRISKKIGPQKFWSTKCIKDLTLRLLNLF